MIPKIKLPVTLVLLTFALGSQPSAKAQASRAAQRPGQDSRDRYIPRKSPSDFRPGYDLSGGRRQTDPSSNEFQDLQRT